MSETSIHRRCLVPTVCLLLAILTGLAALSGCAAGMRGNMALASGDYDLAISRYREELVQQPDSLYLHQRLAYAQFLKKDYAKAEAAFADILTRIPGDAETVFYLCLSRIGKGERTAALDELTRFRWPMKYYHGLFVRDEAVRQQHHPEMGADESIASLREALENGRQEQDRTEREMLRMWD